ncbi:MAG: carboxypeptidase-like regulatory domain-containing protein [candidate division Zixibacteria bacterium]|nr:carboxypeptidase-like regulatory domain-containing protein [candidate division Zixibacteria bacterium]
MIWIQSIKFLIKIWILLQFFSSYGQTKIVGIVYDSESLSPISDVNISALSIGTGTTSGQNGGFSISIHQSPSILSFSHIAYSTKEYKIQSKSDTILFCYLDRITTEIDEIAVYSHIGNVRSFPQNDSTNILDYKIMEDRVLILADDVNSSTSQQIYLTNLKGYTLSKRVVKGIGKKLKFPEHLYPMTTYLFEDVFGEIQLIGDKRVWQIFIEEEMIYLIYPSDFETCLRVLIPMKCKIDNKLFFQASNTYYNSTFMLVQGTDSVREIRQIYDEFGNTRYSKTDALSHQ